MVVFNNLRGAARGRFARLAGLLANKSALRRFAWLGHNTHLRNMDFSHAGSNGG
jgi:hypothetical protein